MAGDLNFHFENEHDSEACKLRSLLNDCCSKQLVNQPTHRCGQSLDWIVVRDDSPVVSNLDVTDTALSDH